MDAVYAAESAPLAAALTVPRALRLLLDPKVPLSPDAPGLCFSSPSVFFRSKSRAPVLLPQKKKGLPGRAHRCVCASFAADAGLAVPVLCERAGATATAGDRVWHRCVALCRLAAAHSAATTAAALVRVLAGPAAPRTKYGALRLVHATAAAVRWAAPAAVRALVAAAAPLCAADTLRAAPRRLAAAACDALCAVAHACGAAAALRPVLACAAHWFRASPLCVAALAALTATISDSDRELVAAAAPLLQVAQTPRMHAGDAGLARALEWLAAPPAPRPLVLLALLLGRRLCGTHARPDAALATSSVAARLCARHRALLAGCGDARLVPLGAALLAECVVAVAPAAELPWACAGCERGAAALLVACAAASGARLAAAVRALGGASRAVLDAVVACAPPRRHLCAVLAAVLAHRGDALDDVQACLARGAADRGCVAALTVLATVLAATRTSTHDAAAGAAAVAHFMAACAHCPDSAALVLAYVDTCLGAWTRGDARDELPRCPSPPPPAEDDDGCAALSELLVDALGAWLPAYGAARLAPLLPAVVVAVLAHPDSVHAVRIVKAVADCCSGAAPPEPALAVLCARLDAQPALSDAFLDTASRSAVRALLFERLTPVLLAQVLLPRLPHSDDSGTADAVHSRLAQLLAQRVAAVHEYPDVKTAAEGALAAAPPAAALPVLAACLAPPCALDDLSLAAVLRALVRVLQPHVRTAAAHSDCTALAAAVARAAARTPAPAARSTAVRALTTLVQAQVHRARRTHAPLAVPVLTDVLLAGISSSSSSSSSSTAHQRVCAAAVLDVVRSMRDVPDRAAVTPVLAALVPPLVAAAAAGLDAHSDGAVRACCVDALGAALAQTHGCADVLGSDGTACAAAALAAREVRAALGHDEARCAAALALLAAVLALRADALLAAEDGDARLCGLLALVERVAQTAAPASAAHRLAQTILSIVSG